LILVKAVRFKVTPGFIMADSDIRFAMKHFIPNLDIAITTQLSGKLGA
jgi:hypothetical protein